MSTEQVKIEINQILETLPEDNLLSVLEYLKKAQQLSGEKMKLIQNFNQILEEDSGLLNRLAQ